jgi:transcription initiation factor TFIIIB Brf1 subunit/transcription initiation factor TFIIB
MQTARRRPFGEIGSNGNVGAQTTSSKDKSKASDPFKVRSVTLPSSVSPSADEKHKSDPLYVVDTYKDIYEHFQRAECRRRPSTTYMSHTQTDVNEKMRTILIDWLVDVHLKFKLLPETLFLAIELIDRFLDKKVVNRQKLQLVGVVAMLLAAKYEEIYPPEVKDFIYIAANTYTRDDILRMERLIFQTLDFNITLPTIYVFLKRGLQVSEADIKVVHTANYFAELTMMEYSMLNYLPSLIAASCIYIANKAVSVVGDGWSYTLEHYMQYKVGELEACAEDVLQVIKNATSLKTQAIRKKYSYSRFNEVSKVVTVDHVQIP